MVFSGFCRETKSCTFSDVSLFSLIKLCISFSTWQTQGRIHSELVRLLRNKWFVCGYKRESENLVHCSNENVYIMYLILTFGLIVESDVLDLKRCDYSKWIILSCYGVCPFCWWNYIVDRCRRNWIVDYNCRHYNSPPSPNVSENE